MALLPKSTAYVRTFWMYDSADHLTPKTGLTVVVNLSKAGAAFGAAGGAVAEVANGLYKVSLSTTDTNTDGDLAYHCTSAGADNTQFIDQVGAVASVAAGGITATSFAAGAVDAAAIATDAIGSAELAASAVTEIAAGILAATLTELAAVPGAAPSLGDALEWLYMASRNLRTTTATADTVKNDAGTTIATAVLSDNGTTFSKGEYA